MVVYLGLPEQVIGVGKALQQQTEDIADGTNGWLRQRLIPQCEQQFGDQLKLPQQFGILSSFTENKNIWTLP